MGRVKTGTGRLSAEETLELWRAYKDSGDQRLRDRLVLTFAPKVAVLLYVHNLTLREIGEILGVTESRVCQIHGQLKRHLREQLQTDEQLLSEVA
jgi:DNA-directed RNA polymerase sigma subunit (sigma70/sigma32)